jgi:glyoxylase-like metal-dependent hydrolase (beta-lactamase superfamily II)
MLEIHVHSSGEAGILANAYIVETARSLVAVDATLTVSEARSFRERLIRLGKPLKAVLITHAHPDHVAGITEWLLSKSTPIYAVRKVEQLMRATEQSKRSQWEPVFKDQWIAHWTYPNHSVEDGTHVDVDDLRFRVVDIGSGGDCDANSVWIMEGEPVKAFVGDLIFNGTHSYLADGNVSDWLNNLGRVRSLLPKNALIYPGHGAPGNMALFESQESYLREYRQAIQAIANGKSSLDESQKKELVQRMKRFLPTQNLEFMIELSADAVAKEMVSATLQK